MVRSIATIACLCFLCGSSPAVEPVKSDPLDPPQGAFSEEWMVLELGGAKAGYQHGTMSRDGDIITSRTLTYIKMGRAAQPIEITMVHSARETLDGRPLSFDSITKMGVVAMGSRGEIDGGRVRITSSQFGSETTQTFDFPAGAKMTWGLFRVGIEHGFEPGTTYEVDIYEPALRTDGAIPTRNVIGDRVKIDLPGGAREAIKVKTTLLLPAMSLESVGYIDETGRVLRAEVALAGLNMTLILTDKHDALAGFDPPEFFMDTLVKVDRSIDRRSVRSIRYTLRVRGVGRRIPELPKTGMQTPGDRTEQSAVVVVSRLDHAALKKAKQSVPGRDMGEYLSASPTLNSKDEAIVKMADSVAARETHTYRIADALRVHVGEIILDKNLNIGFASASEVCRKREGDCSEHAVLLAALGRARGIPSRVVVGLAYVPEFAGRKNVFGFHMWTQFFLAGRWVDFDAALGESDCSPARIALATSSLKSSGMGDLAFAIMDVITGLEIKIDEVEMR